MVPIKYIGTIYWTDPAQTEGSGNITRCLKRTNELVFEAIYERRRYHVKVERHADVFSGNWSLTGPEQSAGSLSCIMIQKDDDLQLSGKWHEDGIEYDFRADLQLVPTFDDEIE